MTFADTGSVESREVTPWAHDWLDLTPVTHGLGTATRHSVGLYDLDERMTYITEFQADDQSVSRLLVLWDPNALSRRFDLTDVLGGARSVEPAPLVGADRQFAVLREWTGLSVVDAARMVGVSRRTPYQWSRGVTPQTDTGARLYRIVRSLKPVVEACEPWEVKTWLRAGSPSPLDMAATGKLDSFEQAAADTAAGRFGAYSGEGRDRVFDLAEDAFEPAVVAPEYRPEPLDWDF